MIFILIGLLFMMPNDIAGLRTSELCSVMGHKTKCPNVQYSYRCNSQYCAVSKESCHDLFELNAYIDSIKRGNSIAKLKFDKLTQRIRKCPQIEVSTEVCLGSYSCSKIHKMDNLLDDVYVGIKIPSYCSCMHPNPYVCDTKYCAMDKETCDDFIRSVKSHSKKILVMLWQT